MLSSFTSCFYFLFNLIFPLMKLKVLLILANRQSGKDKYHALAVIHSNRYIKCILLRACHFSLFPNEAKMYFEQDPRRSFFSRKLIPAKTLL